MHLHLLVWLKDGITADLLFSFHISGGQAASRYITDMKSVEPEKWLALSSSRTKQYTVPRSDAAASDKIAMKYRTT